MKDYEFVSHTADVAMRVFAETLPALFINSAKGLFSLICGGNISRAAEGERRISIKGETLEDLIISWLNELISIFYTYYFLPESYNINIETENTDLKIVKGTVKGNYINTERLNMITEVKSAAYHNVKIEKSNGVLKALIIFDV